MRNSVLLQYAVSQTRPRSNLTSNPKSHPASSEVLEKLEKATKIAKLWHWEASE